MTFNYRKLESSFKNLERVDNGKFDTYRVFDDYGNEAGSISYLGKGEWRAYVDNFPGEKKYFQWNLPFENEQQLFNYISSTGLVLKT